MKLQIAMIFTSAALLLSAAEPPEVPAPITKLALFKNGVCAVIREVKPVPGSFLVKEEMEPIHGTLWFHPSDGLTVRTFRHMVPEPNLHPFKNLTASYAGHTVLISVSSGADSAPVEIAGKVIPPVPPKDRNKWERNYDRKKSMGGMSMSSMMSCCMDGSCSEPFLTLMTKEGETVSVDRNRIISIRSLKINPTVETFRESLLLTPRSRIGGPVTICYLTKGAAWAPAYRLELGADSKMKLSMSAVVMNELEDLNQAEVSLISGFPNILFENVQSPMASGMTMSKFFQQLSGRTNDGTAGNMLMRQKTAVLYNSASADMEMGGGMPQSLPESGKSEDIHYRSIGKISLKGGESLYLPLDSADSTYERIVEWTIRDRRDIWGRPMNWNNNSENPNGDLWDAVSFTNPFQSPITTAPIEITDGGKFLGQTSIQWVNPAQKTILRITRALTVTGNIVENEIRKESAAGSMKSGSREMIRIGNVNYMKQEVEGALTLKSYRKSDTKAVIKLQFSGDLVSAEKNPVKRLLETGLYSINPRNELTWELPLKAEEELKIRYQYSVLVRY